MDREKAIETIMTDLGLPARLEQYVRNTMSRLGVTDDKVDRETVAALKIVIRRDMQ